MTRTKSWVLQLVRSCGCTCSPEITLRDVGKKNGVKRALLVHEGDCANPVFQGRDKDAA